MVKFCSRCGANAERRIPPGEDRERAVCSACGFIHYENPRVVTGTLPERDGRILLCRRAIEPRAGYWTLPAGFLETGESVVAAAARETREEAGARVDLQHLYTLFNLPHIGQVYLLFHAWLLDDKPQPGPETTEQRLFAVDEIPWDDLAFWVVRETLQLWRQDRNGPSLPFRMGDIVPDPGAPGGYRATLWTAPGSKVY